LKKISRDGSLSLVQGMEKLAKMKHGPDQLLIGNRRFLQRFFEVSSAPIRVSSFVHIVFFGVLV